LRKWDGFTWKGRLKAKVVRGRGFAARACTSAVVAGKARRPGDTGSGLCPEDLPILEAAATEGCVFEIAVVARAGDWRIVVGAGAGSEIGFVVVAGLGREEVGDE